MSKINSIKLEQNLIADIKKISPQAKFSISSSLFYEGQVPIAAYLLLEGHIQFLKNKKIKQILKPGTLIGLSELMTNFPIDYEAIINEESKICYLDKSTILEIIHGEDSSLSNLFKKHTGMNL